MPVPKLFSVSVNHFSPSGARCNPSNVFQALFLFQCLVNGRLIQAFPAIPLFKGFETERQGELQSHVAAYLTVHLL